MRFRGGVVALGTEVEFSLGIKHSNSSSIGNTSVYGIVNISLHSIEKLVLVH